MEHDYSENLAEKISVALKEYDTMHQKVFANAKRIESQVIQLYLVTAGILSICIRYFSTDDLGLSKIVDILMIYLLPFLLFASIVSTLVLELRTLYLGQYLSVIEKRINKLLGYDIGFNVELNTNGPFFRIIDYERYRMTYGHRKRRFATNADFIMFTLAYAMIVFPAAIIRLTYTIRQPLWFYIFGGAILFELMITLKIIAAFRTENKKLSKLVESAENEYDLENKRGTNKHTK